MASLIANEFSEATSDLHLSALMAVGFVLFVITLIVNAIARWLVWQVSRTRRTGRVSAATPPAAPPLRPTLRQRAFSERTARTLERRRVVNVMMLGVFVGRRCSRRCR